MVQARGVIHGALLPRLIPQIYPSFVSIEAPTEVSDPESGEIDIVWAPVPGYEALPAHIAPLVTSGISAHEERDDKATWAANAWHIAFAGYYPGITEEHQVRSPEGRAWNILGVEHDAYLKLTRLQAEERR